MKTLSTTFLTMLGLTCFSQAATFYQLQRFTTNVDGALINGSTLTNLSATQLTSGTVPQTRLPYPWKTNSNLGNGWTNNAGTQIFDEAGLVILDNVIGSLPDARLSRNVALLNGSQISTGMLFSASAAVALAPTNVWQANGTGNVMIASAVASNNTFFVPGTFKSTGASTLTAPTIADYSNGGHSHQNTAGGGTLDAAAIASGTIATARLGSGTANSSTFLRGDQTYATPAGGTTPTFGAQFTTDGTTTNLATTANNQFNSLGLGQAASGTAGTIVATNSSTTVVGVLLNTPANPATNIIEIRTNNVIVATVKSNGIITIPAGSVSNPSLAFQADDDGTGTGLYRSAANTLGIAVNGTAAASFASGSSQIVGSSATVTVNGDVNLVPVGRGSILLFTSSGVGQTSLTPDTGGLQLGSDAASPVAQTFHGPDGTGTDKSGGDLTVGAGRNTGTGTAGRLVLATAAPYASTGSTVSNLVPRLTVDGNGIVGIANSFTVTNLTGYLTANVTSTSNTLVNLVFNSTVTLQAGHKYEGTMILFLSDSTAADGAQVDFGGGTATATSFRAHFTSFDSALNLSAQVTSLTSAAAMSTLTGNGMVEVHFGITVNAAGTFIPRVAQNTHSVGTLTTFSESHIVLRECP